MSVVRLTVEVEAAGVTCVLVSARGQWCEGCMYEDERKGWLEDSEDTANNISASLWTCAQCLNQSLAAGAERITRVEVEE